MSFFVLTHPSLGDVLFVLCDIHYKPGCMNWRYCYWIKIELLFIFGLDLILFLLHRFVLLFTAGCAIMLLIEGAVYVWDSF